VTPRMSVIVPTRNRRQSLTRALASVETQTFRDREVIVVDDASSDDTILCLAECFPVARVFTTKQPCGAAAARNRGIREARGEVVAFLDDDDVWRPSYLQAQLDHLDANPSADLSFVDHVERDPDGHVRRPDTRSLLEYPDPLVRLLSESFIHSMSVVACRRSAFDRIGLLDESLSVVHDLDWYARLLAAGGRIVHLRRPLVERTVPGGLVTSHREWFHEENALMARLFAALPRESTHEPMVRASRLLYFARTGLARGSLAFGLVRLGEAFRMSTPWTFRVAAFRLLRRMHLDWRDVPDGLGSP